MRLRGENSTPRDATAHDPYCLSGSSPYSSFLITILITTSILFSKLSVFVNHRLVNIRNQGREMIESSPYPTQVLGKFETTYAEYRI